MSNCIFAYPDMTIDATVTQGLGSWELPPNNIKDKALAVKARFAGALIADFTVSFAEEKHVKVISLVGHNASPTATIRIIGRDTNEIGVYDTGLIPFYGNYYPNGGLPFEHPDFWTGGLITAAKMNEINKNTYFVVTDSFSIKMKSIYVYIEDQSNPAGYFDFSRCFIAPGWTPSVNMGYGASFQYESTSEVESIPGGPSYYNKKRLRRVLSFGLELNQAQMLSYPLEMTRELDIDGEIFFVFDPEQTTVVEQQLSFLGTMKELSALEFPYFDASTKGYSLREVL